MQKYTIFAISVHQNLNLSLQIHAPDTNQ